MKKRFLLLTLIMCLLGGVNSLSLKADEVTIGSGTGTGNDKYFPIYIGNNGKYAISQQIYFASEINMPNGGTITEVSFYTYNNKHTRNIEIYMANTTKANFSSKTDWVTSATEVFEGNVVFGSGSSESAWIKITLDSGFEYDGTSNLMLCVNDITGSTTGDGNYPKCITFSGAANTAKYQSGTHITDLSSLIAYSVTAKSTRNIIKLNFGGGEPETPTEPIAPTLISPADGETDVFNQELKFMLNDESEHNIMFNDKVVEEGIYGKPGDVVTYKPQLSYDEETTYYWQVYAANNGLFANSEVRSFTTRKVTAAPGAVSNVSPANNAIDQFNPTLSWTFGENTEEYQVLLAKASEVFPGVDDEKWTNTQNAAEGSYTTLGLERGTEYKWQVVTKNFKGETSSDIYTFTTLDVPAAVTPNPANGATGVSKNVTLTWTYADNTVTGYRLLFDDGGGFAYKGGNNWKTPGQDGTDSFEITGLAPNTEYSWCVDVKNAAGTRGMYGCDVEGVVFTFTTVDDISPVTEYEVKLNDGFITLEWQYADQKANKYQVCFGETEQNIQIWHEPEWKSRETVVGTTLVGNDSFTISNPGFGDKVYFRVNVRKDEGETVEGATAFFVVLDEEQEWADSYNNANDVFVRANVSVTEEAAAKNVTIEDGASLTLTASLNASKLTINDGGQLFGADKLTKANAYFKMNINIPTEWSNENNIDGWQFISSPFTNALIEDFTNADEYDLYKYDGSNNQWFNHKKAYADGNGAVTFGTGFKQGVGYLASYREETTVTLDGALYTDTDSEFSEFDDVNLSYQNGNELANLHLLGNPFPFNMNIEKATFTNMVEGFAVVTAEGGYDYAQTTIPVGDGFFVKTTAGGAKFSYNHNAKSSRSGNAKSLNIIATGNAGSDNVVVNFAGKGEGFPKLQNFNDDIATVYVQNNDANYGVYNCDENTTEVELCFNANQMGNYTISVEPTGEFSSIVLVDRFTGIETNLLVDDYHFTAMSDANNNRFILKLAVSDQQSAVSDNFVYQSGEELIIEAEGTVQIIDVMGRVVYNSNVENNRINVSDFNNGTYVVRVINETGVKVQKIIL